MQATSTEKYDYSIDQNWLDCKNSPTDVLSQDTVKSNLSYLVQGWLYSEDGWRCSFLSNIPIESTTTACGKPLSSWRAADMESAEQLLTMLDREDISLWLESEKFSDLADGISA